MQGPVFTIIMLISVGVIMVVNGFFAKAGYDMFRRVDATAVANFAFIYAAIFARILYLILPTDLPKIIHALWENAPAPIFHRGFLAFVAFFILWHLIKSTLLRILDLNPPGTPRKLPPTDVSLDSNIPEFPKKSPLIGL